MHDAHHKKGVAEERLALLGEHLAQQAGALNAAEAVDHRRATLSLTQLAHHDGGQALERAAIGRQPDDQLAVSRHDLRTQLHIRHVER